MSPIAFLAVSLAVGTMLLIVAARMSMRRWVRWAHLAAEYGRSDILNAPHVDSPDAVTRLRAQFDAWSQIVANGTSACCRDLDAYRVQFFDVPLSDRVAGFNDEHRYIRQVTAERVDRLLRLASALEAGETRLYPSWVRRIEGI